MKKIGEGKTATIYSDGHVAYKKYHDHYDIRNITYEVQVQNDIHKNTTLHVLAYEIEDHMIKMPLLQGPTLADQIRQGKDEDWLDLFVRLQAETYAFKDLSLVSAFDVFEHQIKASNLSLELKSKALSSLENIEKTQVLCHLDFHPENLMYEDQKLVLLDWTNAKLGHPTMDIASTYIIFLLYVPEVSKQYMLKMTQTTGYSIEDIMKAIPLMAFIKLRENDIEAHDTILRQLILDRK